MRVKGKKNALAIQRNIWNLNVCCSGELQRLLMAKNALRLASRSLEIRRTMATEEPCGKNSSLGSKSD